MSDPNAQVAHAQPSKANPVATATPPSDNLDPLASLHRMQTIAGVSSQTYVAVNGAAVVALILGLASFVVFVLPILLIIPLAAVICAIVALRQIRTSNGTETGRLLAIGGLLAALLAGGGAGGTAAYERLSMRQDSKEISALLEELGQDIHDGKYTAAYNLFAVPFHGEVPLERFEGELKYIQSYAGPIQAVHWNLVEPMFFNNNTAAQVRSVFKFPKSEQRYDIYCVKVQGRWMIYDISEMFPREKQGKGGR